MFTFCKKASPAARKRLLEQAVVRNTECRYSRRYQLVVLESTRGEVLPKMVVTSLHGREVSRTSWHQHTINRMSIQMAQKPVLGLRNFFQEKTIQVRIKFPKAHASDTLVLHGFLACHSNEQVLHHHCCLGPEKTNQSFLYVSCCVYCIQRSSKWHQAIGTMLPIHMRITN